MQLTYNPLLILNGFESDIRKTDIHFAYISEAEKILAYDHYTELEFLELYSKDVYDICCSGGLPNQSIYDEIIRVTNNVKNGSHFICSYEIKNVDQNNFAHLILGFLSIVIDGLIELKTSKTIEKAFDTNELGHNHWIVCLLTPKFDANTQPFKEWDEHLIFFYILRIYEELTKVGFEYRDENYY